MDYPAWFIPGLSKGLVIGVISVLHVFVAQFAVGGGIYLVWMERRAHASSSPELLAWLERHTRFFLLLTMVFGGLSGVAIWFSMSVAAPAATSMLAHNFLFIWASEWTFFLVEIVALLVYSYTYPLLRRGLMSPALHMRVGWVYAGAGFMSLFLINGIISFMLTPGRAFDTGSLWDGFFNPSFWPSLAYRFALCLMLAGMFALFTSGRIESLRVRLAVARTSALWLCLPFLVLVGASWWYYAALPPDRQAAIARHSADIRPFVKSYGWIMALVVMLGFIAFRRAGRLCRALTLGILCAGLLLVGSFEWIRETGRRPWVIPGYMYSNGITVSEGERADKEGAAALSGWAAATAMAAQDERCAVSHGALLFAQQCSACHGLGGPRLDMLPRLEKLAPAGVGAQLAGQGRRLDYMPPFFGNRADRAALAEYLNAARRNR